MGRLRAVIVDDSRAFRRAAAALLEREGIDVVGQAGTSAHAIAVVRESHPDLVLVDVMLAGETGVRLSRRLNELPDTSCPPVILFSTHTEDDLDDLISDCPAVGFLTKSELSAKAIELILAGRRG